MVSPRTMARGRSRRGDDNMSLRWYRLSPKVFLLPSRRKHWKRHFWDREKSEPLTITLLSWKYGLNGPPLIEWTLNISKRILGPKDLYKYTSIIGGRKIITYTAYMRWETLQMNNVSRYKRMVGKNCTFIPKHIIHL